MPLAVEVYENPRTKIGQEEAALLVRFVEEAVEKRAATKEDVLEVRHALEQGNLSLKQEIAEVEASLKREIAEVKAGLERRITDVEHRLEQRTTEVEHRLERRIDRTFYILLAALLILNGDKVLGFLNSLLALFR